MSKVLFACFRDPETRLARVLALREASRRIGARLAGDHPELCRQAGDPLVGESGDGAAAVCFQPVPSVRRLGASVALGHMSGDADWHMPGGAVGDGTFGLFRASHEAVELVTDALATRSIWYYHDDDCLLAASSVRMLVMLLGSFEPNALAVPWMLANGSPGPAGSWDSRLRMVSAGSRLWLDRADWTLRERPLTPDRRFVPANHNVAPHECFRDAFDEALAASIATLPTDSTHWLLPLSGGYDSRLLGCLLRGRPGLRAITWDISADLARVNPEMAVAERLAATLGLPHDSVRLSPPAAAREQVMERFVRTGEGLTDEVSAYLDGFALWGGMAARGIHGILRGDEPFGGFGWAPVRDERDVRLGLGLALLDDLPSTSWLGKASGIDQTWPRALGRQPGEGLEAWRHRLYFVYRVPVVLAALTETKTLYVEVLNPLQARSVSGLVETLPDALRHNKALLIEAANRLSPPVPYASLREGDALNDFLRSDETVAIVRAGLDSAQARATLPSAVIDGLLARLPIPDRASDTPGAGAVRRLLDGLRGWLPHWLKQHLRRGVPAAPADPCLLAFRAWIIVRIHAVLLEDAAALDAAFCVTSRALLKA